MTATVTVQVATGGADQGTPTETTVTAIRFKDADSPTVDTSNPVAIPGSGFKYSYWKSVFLDLATGTGFTNINNVRHYTDGTIAWTLGTGGEARRGNRDSGDKGAPSFTEYRLADGLYDIGDVTNGHEYYRTQTTKTTALASDTTPGAIVDSSDHASAGNTKHLVMQVKVYQDATQGDQTDETFTWTYDEI